MKTKKTLISVFALCTAFMLTACGGKDTVSTEKPQDIQTEAGTEKPQDVQTEVGTEKPQDVQAEAGWTIYISRKTSFLQIMQMYGTRYLA